MHQRVKPRRPSLADASRRHLFGLRCRSLPAREQAYPGIKHFVDRICRFGL